jgi:hypothetical protein
MQNYGTAKRFAGIVELYFVVYSYVLCAFSMDMCVCVCEREGAVGYLKAHTTVLLLILVSFLELWVIGG